MTRSAKEAPDVGFSVDPAALGGVAGQLGSCCSELEQAVTAYHSDECTPDDLASPDMAKALTGFDTAWSQVLNVLGQAMRDLVEAVQNTGHTYSAADAANSAAAERVGGQGS